MTRKFDFPFEMRPLSDEEGGGWLITFPDLPGCMSDGETPEEAMENGKDALFAWIEAAQASGRELPAPNDSASGKFIVRVPRGIHARLVARAKYEGVSMNALVSSILSESLGRRDAVSGGFRQVGARLSGKRRA